MKSKLTRLTCLALTIMLLVSVFFMGVGCQKEQLWSEQLWDWRNGTYGAVALDGFLRIKKSRIDSDYCEIESVLFNSISLMDKEKGIYYQGHDRFFDWDDLYGVGIQPFINICKKYGSLSTIEDNKLFFTDSVEELAYDILGYDVLAENALVHRGKATFLRLNLTDDAYDGMFQGAYLVMERIDVVDPIEGNPPYFIKVWLMLHIRIEIDKNNGFITKRYFDVYLTTTNGTCDTPLNFAQYE